MHIEKMIPFEHVRRGSALFEGDHKLAVRGRSSATPLRPAGRAVINATRGGVYVEPHWYSDRDVAMGALNWWGRVYPGEALTLERRSGAGRGAAPRLAVSAARAGAKV
jgi:hypothetical protein